MKLQAAFLTATFLVSQYVDKDLLVDSYFSWMTRPSSFIFVIITCRTVRARCKAAIIVVSAVSWSDLHNILYEQCSYSTFWRWLSGDILAGRTHLLGISTFNLNSAWTPEGFHRYRICFCSHSSDIDLCACTVHACRALCIYPPTHR